MTDHDDDRTEPQSERDAAVQRALNQLPGDLNTDEAMGLLCAVADSYAPTPLMKLGLLLGAASLILLDRDDDETRH